MAVSLTQTFTADYLVMARSPMIITLKEDSADWNLDSYRYRVAIKAWQGAISSEPLGFVSILVRFPDLNGLGVFDISQVVRDLFYPTEPEDTSIVDKAGSFYIKISYGHYIDGDYFQDGVSGRFMVTNGYAIQQQEINKYEYFLEVNKPGMFMSPVKLIENLKGSSYPSYLNVYIGRNQFNNLRVRYTDEASNTVVWSLPNSPISTQQSIVKVPLIVSLINLLKPFPENIHPVNWFTVELINLSDEAVDTVTVRLVDKAFCDLETDCISYVNRFGVWESIHFLGRRSHSIEQKRDTWNKRIARTTAGGILTYTPGESQEGVFMIEGSNRITVRTGFVNEAINERIQDLMLSPVHFSSALGTSLILETNSIDFQNQSNENLISYQINFRLAGNVIQNIK